MEFLADLVFTSELEKDQELLPARENERLWFVLTWFAVVVITVTVVVAITVVVIAIIVLTGSVILLF